jgi:hypothetical protein
MTIEAGQIYFIRKRVPLGKADYGRPCLVLRVSGHDAVVCFFSTKMEYLETGQVTIYDSDPDFKATGLQDSSRIIGGLTPDVPLDYLKGSKLLGRATGDFKKRIEEWYGLQLG